MLSANTLTYLARQPIYDREGNLFAYELLYRDSPREKAVIQNGVLATAQVLENILSNMDSPKTLGRHKAFVNCSREMLVGKIFAPLNSKRFVLEILEDVAADEAVLKVVREYHARGFEFALDDIEFTPEKIKAQEAFFPYITYAKIDLVLNSSEARAKAASFFKEMGIRLLAEKVETEKEYRDCLEEGFDYFQGFLLAKPELIVGQKAETGAAAIFHLLEILGNKPDLNQLNEAFSRNPELTQSLMKYLHSRASSCRISEYSLEEALSQVGTEHLSEWLMLMLYARLEVGEAGQNKESPLFQNAFQRAAFLKNLAGVMDPQGSLSGKAFVTGLMSRLEFSIQRPLKSVLLELTEDTEIIAALLEREGTLGLLLDLADAVENKEEETVRQLSGKLSLSLEDVSANLSEAEGL